MLWNCIQNKHYVVVVFFLLLLLPLLFWLMLLLLLLDAAAGRCAYLFHQTSSPEAHINLQRLRRRQQAGLYSAERALLHIDPHACKLHEI